MADIILLAVLILFAISGYRKGLIRSVVGVVSLIASFVLAWFLYPIVSDVLISCGADVKIAEAIQEWMYEYMGSGGDLSLLPEGIRTSVETGGTEMIYAAAKNAAQITLRVITFISVMIITRIIISIIIRLMNIISKIPGLNLINRISGLILGMLEGVAVIYIVLSVIYVSNPMGNGTAYEAIEKSSFVKIMYENNPIVELIAPASAENNI